MAEKKGLLRLCNKDCRNCVAGIEIDEYGTETHAVRDKHRGGDKKLAWRNWMIVSGMDPKDPLIRG